MSRRDFEIVPSRLDPPVFSVAEQEFRALPEPPGGVLADYFWTFGSDIEVKAAGLVRFIGGCLPDESTKDEATGVLYGGAREFDDLIHSKDTIVPLRLLHDIVGWLMEEYTSRPTTPSSGSGSGSAGTSATPGDGAPSAESPSTASD